MTYLSKDDTTVMCDDLLVTTQPQCVVDRVVVGTEFDRCLEVVKRVHVVLAFKVQQAAVDQHLNRQSRRQNKQRTRAELLQTLKFRFNFFIFKLPYIIIYVYSLILDLKD